MEVVEGVGQWLVEVVEGVGQRLEFELELDCPHDRCTEKGPR